MAGRAQLDGQLTALRQPDADASHVCLLLASVGAAIADAADCEHAVRSGGLAEALPAAMRRQAGDARVQMHGCELLRHMCLTSARGRERACEAGACEVVIAAMRATGLRAEDRAAHGGRCSAGDAARRGCAAKLLRGPGPAVAGGAGAAASCADRAHALQRCGSSVRCDARPPDAT
jgi:hypothetical protein